MRRINQKKLGAELAAHGFESVTVRQQSDDGRVEADANKLHPLPVGGKEPLYAPIPVSLTVQIDKSGHVKSIEGGKPDEAAVADAVRHVETLTETGQLANAAGRADAAPAVPAGATHSIERDDQGRRVLRRKRFSLA